jgi:hypothetical protein
MQFVCEFALENARNSVLALQKCKNFLGKDFKDGSKNRLGLARMLYREKETDEVI